MKKGQSNRFSSTNRSKDEVFILLLWEIYEIMTASNEMIFF